MAATMIAKMAAGTVMAADRLQPPFRKLSVYEARSLSLIAWLPARQGRLPYAPGMRAMHVIAIVMEMACDANSHCPGAARRRALIL